MKHWTKSFKPSHQVNAKISGIFWLESKTYSEPCQTSKMEVFVKIVNSFQT